MAKEGIARLNEGKFQEAYDLLHRAYQIVPAPTVALLRGRALERLDKLVEAAESYEAASGPRWTRARRRHFARRWLTQA